MLKIDKHIKACAAAILVSLAWGYLPEWLPHFISRVQPELKVLGHISKFREACRETPRSATYCSDQYRIPPAVLPAEWTNKSIGLGFLTSEIVISCAGQEHSNRKIFLGDLDRPYRKANIFREYRTMNLDLLGCKEGLLVQTWVRHKDVRHGLIGGAVVVG